MILLVHDYVPYDFPNFSEFDKGEVGNTLKRGAKLLKEVDNWWLAAGSALGLYRDGEFCDTDNDIDVHFRTNREKVGQLFATLKKRFKDWELVREMFWNHIPVQLCVRDKNKVPFDMIFLFDDIYSGSTVFFNEHGEMIDRLFKIKPLETKYGTHPFLHPIEDYFLDHYGESWKTPQPKKGSFTHEY